MKFLYLDVIVAPLVGAWIEIFIGYHTLTATKVAPLVGAWIEIYIVEVQTTPHQSLLSWERGLKSAEPAVTLTVSSRSSRGSVD